MDCLEPTTIADLVDGRLSQAALADVEAHLDVCWRCADLAAFAVSSQPSLTVEAEVPTRGLPVLPPGTTQLGRYVVRRWIGRGGMGDAYEGFDPQLERRVAIKLLRERGGDGRLGQRRLEREAKTLARLSHPNVVAALDIGVFGNHLFLVMELVEGPTLAAWLRAEQRPWRQVLGAFLEAGEGLAAAHDVGVIHRDFKPQNVLMGADNKARVSDFGLASFERRPATAADVAVPRAASQAASTVLPGSDTLPTFEGPVGTPRYMAPEQLRGQPTDARCDQFSFCVALQEALSGQHPFPHHQLNGSDDAGEQPTMRLGKVHSRALASALRRGLARDPAERYPSLGELLAPLRAVLRPRRSLARTIILVAISTTVSAGGVLVWDHFRSRDRTILSAQPYAEAAIALTGTAADWTDSSRVLATGEGRIRCLVSLPDRRTLRYVWGRVPAYAEDVDVITGQRRSSPLLPAAFAEGCPDLAPNQQDLVFQGYDPDDRPVIFRSRRPDGSDARAVVSAAHPTLQSEPKWLPDGRAFVFDVDERNAGVFSAEDETSRVVPSSVNGSDWSLVKLVGGNGIFVVRASQRHEVRIDEFSWPDLVTTAHFNVRGGCQDHWHTGDGKTFFCVGPGGLARVDPLRGEAILVGQVKGQIVAFPVAARGGLGFISIHEVSDAWARDDSGKLRQLTRDGKVRDVVSCGGSGFLFTSGVGNEPWRILRLAPNGQTVPTPGDRFAMSPACSANGADWWYVSVENPVHQIVHCQDAGCAVLATVASDGLALSPDERRLAFLSIGERGMFVRWMNARGGPMHAITNTETFCAPVWSSNETLWISRRLKGKLTWTEVNVDTGEHTGRTRPGSKACFDDDRNADPLSPALPAAALVIRKTTSQVRFMRLPGSP